ncbi:hypothetical protein FS749_010107 [Ceratobasidium sp. UAMH 11750]|nr:hypothetical protein FS749_010107 [Ceratobasidium sp. UAMH 11750]
MPGSALFEEWTKSPEFAATELVEHLIKLTGAEVCTFRKNTQASYRFVDTARSLCDRINGLITKVESDGDWEAFEAYSEAIDPLEDALHAFAAVEDLDEGSHLHDSTSVDACRGFITQWEKDRKHIREKLDHLRTQERLATLLKPTQEDDKDVTDAYQHDDRTLLSDLTSAIKKYLSQKEITATFSKKIQAMLHEVSKGVQLVEDLLNDVSSTQISDESTVLATKAIMTIYGFMELGQNPETPVVTRLYLRSEGAWLLAKQLLDGLTKHLKQEKKFEEVAPVFQDFFDQLSASKSTDAGLPSSYPGLVKLVGKIGRSYYAQSILLVTLCREAATFYQSSEKKSEHYVALENAFDRTLDALTKAVETMQSSVDEAGLSQFKDFKPDDYEAQDCTKLFKESAKELTLCFKEIGLVKEESGETRLEKAKEKDKGRMVAASERVQRVKTPLPVEPGKLVEVIVKVREGKFDGDDLGEHKIRVQRSTRLSAIGWSVSMDPALKEKLKGRKLLFEQEVSGSTTTTKPVTMDLNVGSLAPNTTCTLYAIAQTPK